MLWAAEGSGEGLCGVADAVQLEGEQRLPDPQGWPEDIFCGGGGGLH